VRIEIVPGGGSPTFEAAQQTLANYGMKTRLPKRAQF